MLKVKVITVGRTKDQWLSEALVEYQKRLSGKIEIEWIFVKKEAEWIEKTAKEPLLIALEIKGTFLSSEQFSRKLFQEWGARTAFAIGGPEGLPTRVTQSATFCWSLSPLTFTHQMVRLLLAEQLYRATEIDKGSAYHK